MKYSVETKRTLITDNEKKFNIGNDIAFVILNTENDLYILEELDHFFKSCWKNYEEVTDIFPTTSKMVKLYNYPYKEVEEKHMIPVSLDRIFEVMKPMYLQKYLANGREYKRSTKLDE